MQCIQDALLPAIPNKEYLNMASVSTAMFQQDGASCHMSKNTTKWLDKKLPSGWSYTGRGEWPPNSPDLNPIENLWAILKDRVTERQPKNEDELCKVLEEEWWAIPQSFIQRLIDTMDERVKRCLNMNGNRFKKVI